MNHSESIAKGLIALVCAGVFSVAVWAGDEDMMNPYQKFDPETGFFINDPSKKRPHQVPAKKQDQGQNQAAASPADNQASAGGSGAPASSTSLPAGSATGTSTLVAVSLLMLGLVVGGFFWLRRDTRKTS